MNSDMLFPVGNKSKYAILSKIKSRLKQRRRGGGVRFALQPGSASFFPSSLVAIDYKAGIVTALIAQSCVPPTGDERPVFRIKCTTVDFWVSPAPSLSPDRPGAFPENSSRFVAAFWFCFHSITRAACVSGASPGLGKRNIW